MKSSDDHIFLMMKLTLMIIAVYHFRNCSWFLVFTIAANSCMIRTLHNLIEGPNFFTFVRSIDKVNLSGASVRFLDRCSVIWRMNETLRSFEIVISIAANLYLLLPVLIFVFLINHAREIRCKNGYVLLYLPVELEPIEITELNWSTEPSLDQVEYKTLRHNDHRRWETQWWTIHIGLKLPCALLLNDMTKVLKQQWWNDCLWYWKKNITITMITLQKLHTQPSKFCSNLSRIECRPPNCSYPSEPKFKTWYQSMSNNLLSHSCLPGWSLSVDTLWSCKNQRVEPQRKTVFDKRKRDRSNFWETLDSIPWKNVSNHCNAEIKFDEVLFWYLEPRRGTFRLKILFIPLQKPQKSMLTVKKLHNDCQRFF